MAENVFIRRTGASVLAGWPTIKNPTMALGRLPRPHSPSYYSHGEPPPFEPSYYHWQEFINPDPPPNSTVLPGYGIHFCNFSHP